MTMLRRLYSFLLLFLIPYLYLRLLIKAKKNPAYLERIKERFAIYKSDGQVYDIWLHAVSLGEVNAAAPLIDYFVKKGKRLLITTMTPTGAEQIKKTFKNKVTHRYIPYDLSFAVKAFCRINKFKVAVIMETELWPNLIHYAKLYAPIVLINARLSEKSFIKYSRGRFFFGRLLAGFTKIYTQSQADKDRFLALGADPTKTIVGGNIKFDLMLNTTKLKDPIIFKEKWGRDRVVVILASTHHNEENKILAHLRYLQQNIPNPLLLIAPRHPERFEKVYQASIKHGFVTGLRSKIKSINSNMEVLIIDSLGELLDFYEICDYAFVGGSLVPVGGHNVLEPIAKHTMVFTGPYTHNFKKICTELFAAKAIEQVSSGMDLMNKIITLAKDPEKQKEMLTNAFTILNANKGTLQFYCNNLENLIN